MLTAAALVVGFIAGAAAWEAMWRRHFEQAVKNIHAILDYKPAPERQTP